MSRINPSNYDRLGQREKITRLIRFYAEELLFIGNGLSDDENLEHLARLVLHCQLIANGDAELMIVAKQLIAVLLDPEFTEGVDSL